MPSRSITAGAILALTLALVLLYPVKPTVSITISTKSLETLLPHAHETGDRVFDVHHGVPLNSEPLEIPETMWVSEITVDALNAPRASIHHLHLIRIDPDGARSFLNATFIAGQDTVPVVRFPAPAGMLFTKGEKIAIDAVLHNPVPPLGEGGVYHDVSVRLTLSGFKEGEGRHVPIRFGFPHVTDSENPNDDDSTFTVPGETSHFTRSSEDNPEGTLGASFTFMDGWIVYMGSHMHSWEGAERVDAFLNGKRLRTLTSHLTDPSIPWSFESEAGPALIRVHTGDKLTVSATYSNPSTTPIKGAMGMVPIYYVQDRFSLSVPWYLISWRIQGWFLAASDAVDAMFR